MISALVLILLAPIAHAQDIHPIDGKSAVALKLSLVDSLPRLTLQAGVGAGQQSYPAESTRIDLPSSAYTSDDLAAGLERGYASYIRYDAESIDGAAEPSLRFEEVRKPNNEAVVAVFGLDDEGESQQILSKDGQASTLVEPGSILRMPSQNSTSVWFFSDSGDYEVDLVPTTVDGDGHKITMRFHVEKNPAEGTDPDAQDEDEDEPESENSPSETDEPSSEEDSSGLYVAPSDGIRRLSWGHIDAFYLYNNRSDMRLLVKDDSGMSALRKPEDVIFVVTAEKYATDLDFGETIPETSGYSTATTKGQGFSPGWTLRNAGGASYATTKVEFTEVSGPGKIVLGTRNIDNQFVSYLDGKRPYVESGTSVEIKGHKHPTWFFSQSGTYTMKARLAGIDSDGTVGRSPEVTYTWEVERNDLDQQSGETDPQVPSNPSKPGDTPKPDNGGELGVQPDAPENNPQTPKPGQPSDKIDRPTKVVLSEGHIDLFNVTPVDGKMVLSVKEDTPTRQATHKPSDVVIRISDKALKNLPEAYVSDLAERGYFLDKNGEDGLPYPGWDTGAVKQLFCPRAPQSCPPLDIEFLAISGPGSAFIFDSANGKPTQILRDSDKKLTYRIVPGTFIHQGQPGHEHAHWLFTDPGVYSLTVRVREADKLLARSGLTSPATSNTETFTFVVGDGTALPDGFGPKAIDLLLPSDPADTPGNSDKPGTADKPGKSETPTKQHYAKGHFDIFNVIADNGKIVLNAKEDTTGTARTHRPEDLILEVPENTKVNLPEALRSQLSNSGYYLPESGNSGSKILWPGWDTNGVRPDFGAVDIKFLDVTGPQNGKVYLFKDVVFRGIRPVLESKSYEVTSNEIIRQATPGHVHASWLFMTPGQYTMTVQAEASPIGGGAKVESEPATYTWIVGGTNVPEEPKTDDSSTPKPSPQPNPRDHNGQANGTDTKVNAGVGSASTTTTTTSGGTSAAAAQCFPTRTGGSGEDTLIPRVKDDRTSPGQWVDPAGLAFAVGDASKIKTNQSVGSIPSGTIVWMISSTQQAGIPWLGANTQSESFRQKAAGSMTISVTSFSGPGIMEVFTSGSLGMAVGEHWFSGNGSAGSGSISIRPNTHVHPNWVFTQPGTYTVGITMSAKAKDGKELSGTTTLTFNVGSASGVTDGHFDLGAEIGPTGSKIEWKTKDGKPCVPTAADLAAAGMDSSLAKTGASDMSLILTGACLLTLVGLAVLRAKRIM
ncbi:TIGR03773 family transporter-associated surface protein [Schaalia vaccimaxillae]|uniref:TIGR03773 family transporter-associated surface protein n=1 Tax=Schaalia vaccimaxillae TaxID=183916 RepID=UPI0013F45366|nr:TIGR03773 family transporter-associated surface protein [Schaalia vaccimaxillae]